MTRKPVLLALAAPACLVTASLAAWLVLTLIDTHPMWRQPEMNLSEAAAARDLGEIVRLIEASEDPDAARDVRPGFLAETAIRATPLEAAVASKDVESVRILLMNGATMTAGVWHHLRCNAEDDEMREFLDRRRPAGSASQCSSHHPSSVEAAHP